MPNPASADILAARLRAAGCVFAEDEARVLLADPVPAAELERRVRRRVAGEPLEYIVGWAEFCGVRVVVAPGVFVPRRRTALLVREALRALPEHAAFRVPDAHGIPPVAAPGPVVVDLCCGAGAIGAAVLAARPDVLLHAADIDPEAVACARATLDAVAGGAGAVTHVGDLLDALPAALRGTVDVIVVNAPYVPTGEIRLLPHEARDHERLATLDGGADGLGLHRRIAAAASGWLAPGGHVVIEAGRRQASASARLFEGHGLTASVVHDEEVDGTAVVARL